MKYGIGLDIGIASVGYATLALDENEEPMRIISMGSRIFDAAENAKDGASLALPRREARGVRRRLRRHKFRLERIRALIVQKNIVTKDELEHLYDDKNLSDIYLLRVQALERALSGAEFARVLLHLAQRRGFKSNRKADSADKKAGALLNAVQGNKERMQSGAYRTVGEMIYKDLAFAECKRNKSENYLATVSRDMVEDEAKQIFAAQRKFQIKAAAEDVESEYLEILLSQRSFEQGPGGQSPYGGDQIYKMVGNCFFETDEKRAAKACYSFEYFKLLQDVNHMRIFNNGKTLPLSREQRDKLISLAHTAPSITYAKLRRELCLPDSALFSELRYRDGTEATENKEKFVCLKSYHIIRKALDKVYKGRITKLSRNQLNEIGEIFTLYKTDSKILSALQDADFEKEDITQLLDISGFSKFGHLSIKACDKIIPFLEQGLNYNEACEAAGYNFKGHSKDERLRYLPANVQEMDNITSPVARRAISQTIKVINAIIRSIGEGPVYVNIELAREMAKTFTERKSLDKDMQDNAANNERIMERIRNEFGKTNATGQDLVKLKLYEEQGGVCLYSLKQIEISRLFEPGYVEVDHIIPYSIGFDDGYKNKVLVMAEENRQKGNRLPLEYLQGDRRDKFIVWTNNNIRNFKKKQILLKSELSKEDIEKFKERNLQDTKTMSRFMFNYINDNLAFAPSSKGKKKRVTAVNGFITSMLRKRYGISKLRADGDTHHAVDAVIIACTTDGLIQKLSRFSERQETVYVQNETHSIGVHPVTGEIKNRIPYPWPQFRKELDARLCANPSELLRELKLCNYTEEEINEVKPIFVSRMPRHKVSGAAHKETIKSLKDISNGNLLVKRSLSELKLDKNGEIDGYYNPGSDALLYDALKARLQAFGGKGEKAFEKPFYKPSRKNGQGALVKKVKIYEKTTLYVPVNGGKAAADNGGMVRIDVFYVEKDGYYFVPIYVADTLKPTLPNKAVIAAKNYNEWKEMDDSNFVFSLYANDLIHFSFKTPKEFSLVQKDSSLPPKISLKEGFAYYGGADIATGSIAIFTHDHTYEKRGMGIKTVPNIQKCQVDLLGNISFVKRETRQYFSKGNKRLSDDIAT
ncbi:MAG: type II CRISPR RNA-guided endonuclease Cas9 [Oscillospiraceae bacterium]